MEERAAQGQALAPSRWDVAGEAVSGLGQARRFEKPSRSARATPVPARL